MSNLSSFFGGGGTAGASLFAGADSVLTVASENTSVTVPSSAEYIAYGVIGGGGSAGNYCANAPSRFLMELSGGGGGFSYADGPISEPAPFNACAVVGAGGLFDPYPGPVPYWPTCLTAPQFRVEPTSPGGDSCITGIPLGVICATGGTHCVSCADLSGPGCITPDSCFGQVGGVGSGGDINTCGGDTYNTIHPGFVCCYGGLPQEVYYQENGGGGAGGLLGNGGHGAIINFLQANPSPNCYTGCVAQGGGGGMPGSGLLGRGASNPFDNSRGGGGGYGSGGGAGSGCQASPSQRCNAGSGGAGLLGRGATASESFACPGPVVMPGFGVVGETGYFTGFTKDGRLSQGKTYLGAAGGGSYFYLPAGQGGGGSGCGLAGFGGGGGYGNDGGFGGGGAGNISRASSKDVKGGQGVAIVEYWVSS